MSRQDEGNFDLYCADHNRIVDAVKASRVPAIGLHLERGETAQAFAAANIVLAFESDRLPSSLSPTHRTAFGQQLAEIDPRLLLLHFPRHDDGSFAKQSVFLFSAPLGQPKSAMRKALNQSSRGTLAHEDTPQLWARVRPETSSPDRLVIELVAFDGRREAQRWDNVPWRYSRRYSATDFFIQDGADFDFGMPAVDIGEFDPARANADESAAMALALLDADRIEEAMMVCGVQLSKSAEALLYGDLDTVFFERLRTLFPRADTHALQEDARTLARPRSALTTSARRYLRQTSPWTFAHVPDSIRAEWRGEEAGATPLCSLDDEVGAQAVWLTLEPGPTLNVEVAMAPRFVAAQPQVVRGFAFEWRRMGLLGRDAA